MQLEHSVLSQSTALRRCADEHQTKNKMKILIYLDAGMYGKHGSLTVEAVAFFERLKALGHQILQPDDLSWREGCPVIDLIIQTYCRCCGIQSTFSPSSRDVQYAKSDNSEHRPPILFVRTGKATNKNQEWVLFVGSLDIDAPDEEFSRTIELAGNLKVGD